MAITPPMLLLYLLFHIKQQTYQLKAVRASYAEPEVVISVHPQKVQLR